MNAGRGGIWAALRVPPQSFDAERASALFAAADGVVLDAFVAGALGGTGVPIDWRALAGPLTAIRTADAATALLVLAADSRRTMCRPRSGYLPRDVVDVSSGVEAAPGIKDHTRVQRFVAAARGDSRDDEQLSLAGVQ